MSKGEIGTPNFGSTYGSMSNFEQNIADLYEDRIKDSMGE